MAYSPKTIKDAVKSLLDKNNTTGSSYNISASLYSKVGYIRSGTRNSYMNDSVPETMYPIIYVEFESDTEEIGQLGGQNTREIHGQISLIPIIMHGMGVSREHSDDSIIQLTENLKTLLRNKRTLSETVGWITQVSTGYGEEYFNDTWNSMSRISFDFYKLSN